jgi:outer membrane protein OmpA-like peptidoglycan-associated protein
LHAALASALVLVAPRAVRAQSALARLALRGELTGGAMLTDYQAQVLHLRPAIAGAGRVAFTIVGPLAVQASFASAYFPSDLGAGQLYTLTGGLRFEPKVGRVGRFFIDANLGAGFMPDRTRFAFDVGLGFEFALGRYVGLGPVVRYGQAVAAPPNDYPSDAIYLTAGASLTVRFGDPDRDPRRDDDGDRVRNAEDECPDDPAGLHPDPRRRGCPLPDRDGDNVPDARDACDDLPGAPSQDPRRNGCPGLVVLERGQLRINEEIRFRFNSDEIDPDSRPVLESVSDALRAEPEIRRVSIEGHTDDTGEADVNQRLSERRAESVRRWLVAHGVAENRMEARGYGESRPRVRGSSQRARDANRRVEFRIVDPAP